MARPRKSKTRHLQGSIFIFCEGRKTEPNYFNSLIKSLSFPGETAIVKVIDTEYTDLVSLVREAKLQMKYNKYKTDKDQYWVVVDKDGYTKHAEGFDSARRSGIEIAFSSISFEYWILCHYTYTTRAHNKCDDLIKDHLKKYYKNYEKGSNDVYHDTHNHIDTAKNNAKKCRDSWKKSEENDKIYNLNPYTNIDELIDKIKFFRSEIE